MTMLTQHEYRTLSSVRSSQARSLLITALAAVIPEGYELSVDNRKMYANALIALRPIAPSTGSRMISFMHDINYRNEHGLLLVTPTQESIRAHCDIKRDASGPWQTDTEFGEDVGRKSLVLPGDDLTAGVRALVSHVCTKPPFVNLQWRNCEHDPSGKWELFDGDRKLQSVWKSGSMFGTLMGTAPRTLRDAKSQAEAASRYKISCEHQERLAGLSLSEEAEEDTCLERPGGLA